MEFIIYKVMDLLIRWSLLFWYESPLDNKTASVMGQINVLQ